MRRHTAPIVLVLVSFTILSISLSSPPGARAVESVRAAVGSVFGPMQQATSATVRPLQNTLTGIGRERSTIEQLERANQRLTAENHRLRAASLVTTDRRPGKVSAAARVIALGPVQSYAQTATIDTGSDFFVRQNSGVVSAQGLVGRILRVGRTTATVLLIGDPRSVVGARVDRRGELGLVRGDGLDELTLTMLDPKAQVRIGDRVVTWGSAGGRPYPPNVPIGRVTAVESGHGNGVVATVRPAVDLTALDTVVLP